MHLVDPDRAPGHFGGRRLKTDRITTEGIRKGVPGSRHPAMFRASPFPITFLAKV